MKKVNLYFIWIISMSILTTSCKDDALKDEKSGKVSHMNIANAKTLYITSHESISKLYGIKKSSMLRSMSETDGEIYEIEYFDEDSKPIEGKSPHYIYDAGDFLILFFKRSEGWLVEEEVCFVRKIDGVVFEIADDYIPSISGYNGLIFNSNVNKRSIYSNVVGDLDFINICYDKNDNFYYTAILCQNDGTCPHTLYRVPSISNAAINFKQISAESETVWGFCVDDAGNAIYGRAGGEWMRYVSNSGVISEPIPVIIRAKNSDYPLENYLFVWTGTDGIMSLKVERGEQFSDGSFTSHQTPKYYLMKMEDGQFIKKREVMLDFSNSSPSSYNVFYINRRVLYSHYNGSTTTLVDISNESSYCEIPCSVKANAVINDKLYNFNAESFSLTHIDVDNGATTLIYDLDKSLLSDFHIACIIDVTESGITFSAYRLSDNTYIVARINSDNIVTILQDNSGKVSAITSLNP